jgi:hypothetical protein
MHLSKQPDPIHFTFSLVRPCNPKATCLGGVRVEVALLLCFVPHFINFVD